MLELTKPRTRSQGLPEGEEGKLDQQTATQRRMLRELRVRLETLRLLPAGQSEGGDPSETQQRSRGQPV